VNIALALLIVLVVSGLAIAAMLWVRRKAPEGSYFNDGDRAAGVFGVLATGFAVLLGFVVFLAFTSYDTARAGAELEAHIVAQQVETAQLLPSPASEELTSELIPVGRGGAMGPHGDRDPRRRPQPLGDEAVPNAPDGRSPDPGGGGRVQQVAR
jgi:hypothetical protein